MRLFRMILECTTPLHCGGGEDLLQDQPVIRDAFGLWRIPGSSLAGALRSLAGRVNDRLVGGMFGDSPAGEPVPSLIWCEDGILLDFDGTPALDKKLAGKAVEISPGPFVRDHVRLDEERDSAVEGGKFDAEIVPAGARFLLEFRCDGWNRGLTGEETAFFDALCAQVLAGRLELGGKSSNGYGQYRVLESQMRALNLEEPEDMRTWLHLSRNRMFAPREGREVPLSPAPQCAASGGLSGTVEMRLSCDTPILIGGGQPALPDGNISEADIIFALSPWLDYIGKRLCWRPVVPGSSLKGVLRHAVYRILRDLGMEHAKALSSLDGLFGHIQGDKGQCGKVIVEDGVLSPGGAPAFTQHVSIDSFTGGALDGALFSEEPYWADGLELPARIHVRNAGAAEAALVWHAILDLAQGRLCVGSGANRGNGRLRVPGDGPAAILAALGGTLAWKGSPILEGDGTTRLSILKNCAREWDQALESEVRA